MKNLKEKLGGGYETPDLRMLSFHSENGFCVSGVKTSTIDDITDDEDVINF